MKCAIAVIASAIRPLIAREKIIVATMFELS
jgi:hypothetical protein